MLTIEHLNCGYGKHEILHDISVTIPDKKITAIVGQSGCGKTTFLKTLNRMVEENKDIQPERFLLVMPISNLFRKKL